MSNNDTNVSEQSPLLPNNHPSTGATGLCGPDVAEDTFNGTVVISNAHPKDVDGDQDGHAIYGTTRDLESAASAATPPVDEEVSEMRKRLPYVVPAIAIGVYLSAIDLTIIVASAGRIGSDLNALASTSWIATAYLLTITSFQPLYGKLSDIFGRKPCLLFAYLVFGIGSLLCGLARDITELIAARAFTGIGGGGMTTIVSIYLSDTVSLRERGTWQGYINLVYAAGAASGAPIGGLLSDSVGWRWAFLGQAPLCIVAFVAVAIMLKEPPNDNLTMRWKQKLARVDFLGATVLIAAVFALLLALDHGSNVAWRSTFTLVALGLSLPLFGLFFLVEAKAASEPFAPGPLIFDRGLFACYACNFFSFAGWLAALFYVPLYFQAVEGLTATEAGVRLVPNTIVGVAGSLFAGFYMQRTGRYYWLTVACYASLTAGLVVVLLSTGGGSSSFSSSSPLIIILGLCIAAFSNGVGVTSTLIGLIANAKRQDQAVVTACSYLFRSLGCVFGVSMSATVANQVLRSQLQARLGVGQADEVARRARESLEYIRTLEPGVRSVVEECYAMSTRGAFAFQIALVAGAAISAWFIRETRLGA